MLERVAGMLDDVWLTFFVWRTFWFRSNIVSNKKKMLDKRHLTCRLHVLILLNQQMLYNNVRTCSRALEFPISELAQCTRWWLQLKLWVKSTNKALLADNRKRTALIMASLTKPGPDTFSASRGCPLMREGTLSTENGNGNDDAETEKGLGRDRCFGGNFNIIKH